MSTWRNIICLWGKLGNKLTELKSGLNKQQNIFQ
jgi:hypothetical protein